jgi:hypothetical protein
MAKQQSGSTKKKRPGTSRPDRRSKVNASMHEANKKTRADVPATRSNKAASGKIQGGQSGKKG